MKQRFSISGNTGGEKIVIKEYAELDKGTFSLLCEESYEVAAVEAALEKGRNHVIALLRTESFFPTNDFAEKLTAGLMDFIKQGGSDLVTIDADDSECISSSSKDVPEEVNGSVDVLLDVDGEDIIDDDEPVEKLEVPIKIAEDETVDISKSL